MNLRLVRSGPVAFALFCNPQQDGRVRRPRSPWLNGHVSPSHWANRDAIIPGSIYSVLSGDGRTPERCKIAIIRRYILRQPATSGWRPALQLGFIIFAVASTHPLLHISSQMETSLRYGGDAKALRIHAKEKVPIDSKTFLQLHGELDTRLGAPGYLSAMIRHFYPDLSASLGVGVQYDKNGKLRYNVRAKKAFPVTTDGLLSFNVKGRCDVDKEFKQWKSRGGAEFSWSIFNFQKDQDVRLKLGFEMFEQVPYLQVRENNWTFNADTNGRWNLRYDL